MPSIIGLNLTKISAERKNVIAKGGLEIKTQPQITDIKETKLQGFAKEDLIVLSVDFSLISGFTPDVGNVSIVGNLIYKTENIGAIMKEWKKSNAMPPEDGAIILNHIITKCSVMGLYLADALNLPPIIALPKVEARKEKGVTSAPAKEKK